MKLGEDVILDPWLLPYLEVFFHFQKLLAAAAALSFLLSLDDLQVKYWGRIL
jgi:hypothetical protein